LCIACGVNCKAKSASALKKPALVAGMRGNSTPSSPSALHGELFLAKITSAFIFITFQRVQIGRSNRLLTIETSGLLFNSSAGWDFGEERHKSCGNEKCACS
jgi:hypothetical protein